MTAANFCTCGSFDVISILLLCKNFRIFPLRMAAARIKLFPCIYFALQKIRKIIVLMPCINFSLQRWFPRTFCKDVHQGKVFIFAIVIS
jgi:hypothetical protein